MKFVFFIAKRYFFSRQNTNAINIISFVSMLAVMVVTIAMLIIFSSLNGFEGLVKSLYSSFYPDISISVKEGKTFKIDELNTEDIKAIKGVMVLSSVLEEKALVTCQGKQAIAVVKGVDEKYVNVNRIKNKIIRGRYELYDEFNNPRMLVGAGLEARLDLNVTDPLISVQVHMPKRGRKRALIIKDAFRTGRLFPSGTFSIQQEFDAKYIIVPISFSRKLLKHDQNIISRLEIKLKDGADFSLIKEEISRLAGPKYIVETRYEQNSSLYQVMNMESWVVYCLLTLILLIAGFNILGSLVMLVLDKTKDIFILRSIGVTDRMIRWIFWSEGMMFSGVGVLGGMIIAALMIWCQQVFGIVQIPGDTFVVSAYPMDMEIEDFFLVFITVIFISILSSWYPAMSATKKQLSLKGQY